MSERYINCTRNTALIRGKRSVVQLTKNSNENVLQRFFSGNDSESSLMDFGL